MDVLVLLFVLAALIVGLIGLFRWSDRALMACIGVVCLALAGLVGHIPV
jgi:hypothetical protein